ncbi:MAG: DNA-directed RNA polymerase subunit omega [Ruminococcaceae bacterium]|nr:DNA-directed RNA polymerase subunit omega [Oscillospiraceae bacterium]
MATENKGLNVNIGRLIEDYDNRYRLVMDIAKRARDISEKPDKTEEEMITKPVSLAIDSLADDRGLKD